MQNVNQEFFNRLTLTEFFIQYLTLIISMQDFTNTDIVNELQKQDREYLEKIVSNQKKILANQDEILGILKDIKED